MIIPFGLSGFSGCEKLLINRNKDRHPGGAQFLWFWFSGKPGITPLYLQSHACSPRFDPTLRFCPFRVPGEEPRQPPHGHHPARPLLQEQVHQADLPGGRCHGENNVMLACLSGRFMSDSCFHLLLFKLMSCFWLFLVRCPLAFIFLPVLALTNGTLPVCCSVSSDFSSHISFCVAISSPAPPLPR